MQSDFVATRDEIQNKGFTHGNAESIESYAKYIRPKSVVIYSSVQNKWGKGRGGIINGRVGKYCKWIKRGGSGGRGLE